MDKETAPRYIRENFEPKDRLAVVLLNKRTREVIQRLALAEKIAAPDFQSWLRLKNREQFEVYVSMNTLQPEARGRTKEDISEIRHVYLDFDDNGKAAVDALRARPDVPEPNYVLNSSPDKYQVVWKVEGFAKEQAEHLQRALVRDTGADPAATDSARVLRIPGFYNQKYSEKHFIRVETLAQDRYRPEQFPQYPAGDQVRSLTYGTPSSHRSSTNGITQSERDWAYARRALLRGEPEHTIVAAIANHRTDKPNPHYYAELTVCKAVASLRPEVSRSEESGLDR